MKKRVLFLFVGLLSTSWMMAETGDLPQTNNLVTENIPKIPASLVEEVARYTEFRAARLADWHPTKREMLITTRFGDTAQVHHVKFPGGARTQLTFFPDSVGGLVFVLVSQSSVFLSSRAKFAGQRIVNFQDGQVSSGAVLTS